MTAVTVNSIPVYQYTYNAENRLETVTKYGTNTEMCAFYYDGDGTRVWET